MTNKSKYSVILFDLFDTLLLFDPSLLPVLTIDGKKHFTTAKAVFSVFRKHFPDTDFDVFHTSFRSSYKAFQELKNSENREYTNRVRFDIMFRDMGIEGIGGDEDRIKNELVEAHMESLTLSMIFPEIHRDILLYFYEREFGMSIISNFDHAPTAYKLLDKFNITNYFDKIFISDEVGWRKPHPIIFNTALQELGKTSSDVILVGDNYNADIVGASGIGIDTVYLDKTGNEFNDHFNFKISDLRQLIDII